MLSRIVTFPYESPELQMFSVTAGDVESSTGAGVHSSSLLYGLSVLKEKVHQMQSLVTVFISPVESQPESTTMAMASMATLIQESIVTASSMMFACQQMGLTSNSGNNNTTNELQPSPAPAYVAGEERRDTLYSNENFEWYGESFNDQSVGINEIEKMKGKELASGNEGFLGFQEKNCDIIQLNASDLLAKYTHYCKVCGKGFKRDANLRMHMRAHGDEYKSNAALSNPMKKNGIFLENKECLGNFPRKYSCPQEGCRWNLKHAKFQPLKSMICAKNHYKRSHCPKMYVCKRCVRKQFSVLSDLRTHEKHCGDLKWQCSCGTTFSRKDKLLGHVALFVGHNPVVVSSS